MDKLKLNYKHIAIVAAVVFAIILLLVRCSDNEDTRSAEVYSKLVTIQETYYPDGSYFEPWGFVGASGCFGFAKRVQNLLFDNVVSWEYDGTVNYGLERIAYVSKPFTASKIKSLMSKAKPGDIIQIDVGNKTSQHSMIFCCLDKDGFVVYDANWEPYNEVDIRTESYDCYEDIDSSRISILRNIEYFN